MKLIALTGLALLLIAGFVGSRRLKLGSALQMAASWALIFLGAIAVFALKDDISSALLMERAQISSDGAIALNRKNNGHYYVTIDVNETPVRFLVDTGASHVVLSQADAKRVGLDPENLAYFREARTANGTVATAPVRLDRMTLGPYEDRSISALVNQGEMQISLLGMSYLHGWTKIEFAGGQMRLIR